jgi:hypothetical protein
VALEEAGARRRRLAGLLPAGRRPFIGAGLAVTGAGADRLVLDGLLLGGGIAIAGSLGELAVFHATLGATAAGLVPGITAAAGATLARIAITASVLGAVTLPAGVAALAVADSIIGEDRTADGGAGVLSTALAVDAPGTDVAIARSTVFGRIAARTADLDHVLAAGRVRAARRQEGCVRYSLVPLGSRTAQRFRCQPDLALEAAGAAGAPLGDAAAAAIARRLLPRFTATRWEAPGFGQLHPLCPAALAHGGEGGLEMGAFAAAGGPIRLANLRLAVGDTLRVGLEAGVITVT